MHSCAVTRCAMQHKKGLSQARGHPSRGPGVPAPGGGGSGAVSDGGRGGCVALLHRHCCLGVRWRLRPRTFFSDSQVRERSKHRNRQNVWFPFFNNPQAPARIDKSKMNLHLLFVVGTKNSWNPAGPKFDPKIPKKNPQRTGLYAEFWTPHQGTNSPKKEFPQNRK